MKKRTLLFSIICLCFMQMIYAEDGSRLWLHTSTKTNATISASHQSPTTEVAIKELQSVWKGTPIHLQKKKDKNLSNEGYRISKEADKIIVTSPSDNGLLYAAYHLIRLQQTQDWESVTFPIIENPT